MTSLAVRLGGLWLVGAVLNCALSATLVTAVFVAVGGSQASVNALLVAYAQLGGVAVALVVLVVRATPAAGGPAHGVDQALLAIGVVVAGHLGWLALATPLLDVVPPGFLSWAAVVVSGGLTWALAGALFALLSAIRTRPTIQDAGGG